MECNNCKADVVRRQVGKFTQYICTECEREIRPNGEYATYTSSKLSQDRTRELITEQYEDLTKDMN